MYRTPKPTEITAKASSRRKNLPKLPEWSCLCQLMEGGTGEFGVLRLEYLSMCDSGGAGVQCAHHRL